MNTRNFDSWNASTSSVAQTIPVDPSSPTIQFANHSEFGFTQYQNVLDYLDISIVDAQENFVNFNNCHWTLVLCFSYSLDVERFPWKVGFESALLNGAALEKQRFIDVDPAELSLS
jgi:hypothetical protein